MSSIEYWLSEIHTDVRTLRGEVSGLRGEVSKMQATRSAELEEITATSSRRRLMFEGLAAVSTLGLAVLGLAQIT